MVVRSAEQLDASQNRSMVKMTAAIGVIFFLVATGGALGQKQTFAGDSERLDASVSSSAGRQGERASTWRSLPDAPSPGKPAKEVEGSGTGGRQAKTNLPLTLDANGVNDVMSETGLVRSTIESQVGFAAPDHGMSVEKTTGGFWSKYLYIPLPSQSPLNSASTGESFMGRTVSAASRILLTRDESGKERLNMPYIIAVLASAAAHTSSRPNGPRSTTATLNDFGSTIGGDAGVNVFHAFQPEIGQVVKKVTPKFVYRIQRRLMGGLASRAVGSISAR